MFCVLHVVSTVHILRDEVPRMSLVFCNDVDEMRGWIIRLARREPAWIKEDATGFLETWVENMKAVAS